MRTNGILRTSLLVCAAAFGFLAGCGPSTEVATNRQSAAAPDFAKDVLLHASFTRSADAEFARGDAQIYTADSYEKLDERSPGLSGEGVHRAVAGEEFGSALHFTRKDHRQVFYLARNNTSFSPEGWSGTISFWLRVDPAVDLAPGFTDPIQITDAAYDDACIWVDFTKDNPRSFRLGVFGNRESWNPENTPTAKHPAFEKRLVAVDHPPFSSEHWTHITIVHEALGTPQGKAALYLNGELQGESTGIVDAFTWDEQKATIRLGVNYIGWFDELSIFSRALSPDEVKRLTRMRATFRPQQEAASGAGL